MGVMALVFLDASYKLLSHAPCLEKSFLYDEMQVMIVPAILGMVSRGTIVAVPHR